MAVLAQRAAAGDAREIWTEAEDADWGQISTAACADFLCSVYFSQALPAAKLFSAASTC